MMDRLNPTIALYNMIRNKTDEATAGGAIAGVQTIVNAEVTNSVNRMENKLAVKINGLEGKVNTLDLKLNNLGLKVSGLELRTGGLETRMNIIEARIGELKAEMIDRITSAKIQTILWIVGVGILQVAMRYLFR